MVQTDPQDDPARRFADEARRKRPSALGEVVSFLVNNKKWWLAPIVIVLLLIGVLVVLSGTAAAPFIYPLF